MGVLSAHLKLDNCRGENWTLLPRVTAGRLILAVLIRLLILL